MFTMFPLTRTRLLGLAATAGVLFALSLFALSGAAARSDELAINLGPVGPHEPIFTTVGSKRIIAFYLPGSGQCAVQMVIGDIRDPEAALVSRIRVDLKPGQMVHLDTVEQKSLNVKSLNLACGENAEKLAIVNDDEPVAFGAQQVRLPMKASTSGF